MKINRLEILADAAYIVKHLEAYKAGKTTPFAIDRTIELANKIFADLEKLGFKETDDIYDYTYKRGLKEGKERLKENFLKQITEWEKMARINQDASRTALLFMLRMELDKLA